MIVVFVHVCVPFRQDHQKKIFKQHMETHNKQLTDLQQRLETKKKGESGVVINIRNHIKLPL